MTVSVRRAQPEDFERWLAVHEAVAAEGKWIGAELPLDLDAVREHFDDGVNGERRALFLAESEDGTVVGNFKITVWSFGVADFGMAVLDGWRGKGVGSRLLEAGIAFAREHGAHKIALQMWPHNTGAQRLYEKYGFVVEGRLRRHYPRQNGELWDAVIMGLVLDEDTPGSSLH